MESTRQKKLKALVVYCSATGNTGKVANAIHDALLAEDVEATLLKVQDAAGEELYDYDLVFLGSPSIEFLPPAPMMRYIKDKLNLHRGRGDIKLCAPKVPGKTAVVFCTYSGPHTGLNEATTAGKYMAQLLEHIGFEVAGEWYVIGEFHNGGDLNTLGRLGDIRGCPNEEDLARVRDDTSMLVRSMVKQSSQLAPGADVSMHDREVVAGGGQ